MCLARNYKNAYLYLKESNKGATNKRRSRKEWRREGVSEENAGVFNTGEVASEEHEQVEGERVGEE